MPEATIQCAGKWIKENIECLQNSTKSVFYGQLQMLFFGGPDNGQKFTVENTEEVFYQPDGGAILIVKEQGKQREIPLKQGDLLILPERVEHSFKREAGTIGSVIKKAEAAGAPLPQPNHTATVLAPVNVKEYITVHLDEINKAPHPFFGPPQTKSVLTLYGKGSHKFNCCSTNELVLIVQCGEAQYRCDLTGVSKSLHTFHLAHFKPNSQFTLEIPEGGVCMSIKVPV